MDIPVFHDDQHGTAIIAAAGLINALHLTGRDMKDTKVVCNGAGAAASPASSWSRPWGIPHRERHALRHQGRDLQGPRGGHEPVEIGPCGRRPRHARWPTRSRAPTSSSAFGQGRADGGHGRSMAPNPIIFAMANPDPEITPEEAAAVRDDAIVATGRSDYPNQVNNVLGFPYIFRGALDVQATTINDEMKIACRPRAGGAGARGSARRGRRGLSRQPAQVRPGIHHPCAVRPAPDHAIPPAVAQAAMDSGVGAGRSSTWMPTGTSSRPAAIRSPARCSGSSRRSASSPSASSSPRARRSR
jgi:malate dehydrogenase (oxaloacetate-decarboxylating)(NADP+)